MERKFKDGSIVVALRQQICPKGKILIHEGAIVKVKDSEPRYFNEIEVWRSKQREQSDITTEVNQNNLREATEQEIKSYNDGIRCSLGN
jgi:hypothetical protein